MESSRCMTLAEVFKNVPIEFFSVERRAKMYRMNGKRGGERSVTVLRNGEVYWSEMRNGELLLRSGKIMTGHADGGIGA